MGKNDNRWVVCDRLNLSAYTPSKSAVEDGNGHKNKLFGKAVFDDQVPLLQTSGNFHFSAAVASFGILLRGSEVKESSSLADVLEMAKGDKGEDEEGYRAVYTRMVRSTLLVAEK